MDNHDHRVLGPRLDLFHRQNDAPGTAFGHPRGVTLYCLIEDYLRRSVYPNTSMAKSPFFAHYFARCMRASALTSLSAERLRRTKEEFRFSLPSVPKSGQAIRCRSASGAKQSFHSIQEAIQTLQAS
jgi:hypothetical protein